MRIKTGERSTAELTVDIQYTCSQCKTENLTTDTIKSEVYTATIMGINVDGDTQSAVRKKLYEKTESVLDSKNPHRFRTAQLKCSCRKCGFKEPWARMNYDHLIRLQKTSRYAFVLLAIILFVSLDDSFWGFNYTHGILLAFLIMVGIAHEGIDIYMVKNNKEQEQQILALPQESLPIILPHSEERHRAFANMYTKNIKM